MALRVLIVEDDILIALDLEDMIERAGHATVGIATNIHDALHLASTTMPDFAFMDIDLGRGPNGIEVARRLRHEHNIRVLFVTARGADTLLAVKDELDPVGLVTKPFRERDIQKALLSLSTFASR